VVEVEDARRLSPAVREVVRLRAVAALESGAVRTYRQAAEMFGVFERSVDSWWRAYRTGSAIASRGALYFTAFTGRFTATVCTGFLDRLARQAGRRVYVIADRHPVHRSRTVRACPAANAERIELRLIPGYSPELNPDEPLNADVKRHVHASRTRSADDLAHETRRFLHRRQRRPHSAVQAVPGEETEVLGHTARHRRKVEKL